MKRILLTGLLVSLFSLSAFAALKEGDNAPDFSAQASLNGKAFTFSLQSALKKGPVVVYFYPSAYTGGCNIQAHTFAVNQDKFAAAGVTIIGVSLDSIERLNTFSADPEYCAGKFPVASDVDGKISKSFDLSIKEIPAGVKDSRGMDIGHNITERTTFIIASDGKIAASVGGVSPEENVNKALALAQKIAMH
ncbi:peroxiredoxin [Sapientia aquatica]|uniref:thioredoxin-dependent peroxiredoxin n=1 Tax=Sapientia aquatica TaxID=1549640 RepID=A0A4R5W265_9BURK|nr:peroxiredoxin [Sapientia aquatica]TDK66465.1 peroxiredoxin [Sapientia aquatica]